MTNSFQIFIGGVKTFGRGGRKKDILGQNFVDPTITQPKLCQTERTRLMHPPSEFIEKGSRKARGWY